MNRQLLYRRTPAARPGGFTLVELLVAVTIIAILATVVLSALGSARIAARRMKTKSTIAKLHNIVVPMYESYQTRRVPINITGLPPVTAAQLRLQALRHFMRWEMPERLSDIVNPASSPPVPADETASVIVSAVRPDTGATVNMSIQRSGLARSFFRRYLRNPPPDATYASAELLYLMVTTANPDARDQFHDNEVGDADGDGWREFHDGWGNPIQYVRWAPGFIGSDLQAEVAVSNVAPPPLFVMDASRTAQAAVGDHDPFDPFKVDMDPTPYDPLTGAPDDNTKARGWHLVPLVYSAGPDGVYDINDRLDSAGATYAYINSPYIEDLTASTQVSSVIGTPTDLDNTSVTATGTADGELGHYDNIHNHRLED